MVPGSSPMLAAMLSSPTGPPSKRWITASSSLVVHQVKALRVHVQHGQRLVRHLQRDAPVALDLRIVARGAASGWQCAVPRERRASSMPPVVVQRHFPAARAARNDARELWWRVNSSRATMPKRSRSGWSTSQRGWWRPTSVKGCRSSLMLRAAGPSPIMMSI